MLMCVITPARQALCCHLDAVPLLLLCLAPDKLLNCCLLLLYIFLNSLPKPIGKECLPHPQRVYHHFLGVLSTVMVPEFQLLEAYCVQVLHTTPSGSSVNVGWVAMFNLRFWSRSSCTWCVAWWGHGMSGTCPARAWRLVYFPTLLLCLKHQARHLLSNFSNAAFASLDTGNVATFAISLSLSRTLYFLSIPQDLLCTSCRSVALWRWDSVPWMIRSWESIGS